MKKKRKKTKDFFLDMPFEEVLERYSGTDKQEVERLIAKSKGKKPGGKKKRKPPGKSQTTNVVALSTRRKRKYV